MAEQPAFEDHAPQLVDAQETPDDALQAVNDEDVKSKRVTLADFTAKGAALYNARKFEEASEVLSEASNLQAELNGETAPENAEILFQYGRCLFRVGQSKSNVLGGKAPNVQSGKPKPSRVSEPSTNRPGQASIKGPEDTSVKDAGAKSHESEASGQKPLFQFNGDENFDDSDDEDAADAEDEDGEEEDDDDLSIAFEILDLARVCYLKQLELINDQDKTGMAKGKDVTDSDAESPTVRHIKERLADTHDCLAEISLENEKYPNAIDDGRTSLNYKLELYPEESEIIAEAHYKLSLALEFASVTTAEGDNGDKQDMDQGLRDEAVREMELAIKSFRLKLQGKEVELATMASPEDNELARKAIAEMKDVIGDMDRRLVELKADPIDTKALLGAESNPLGGILGAALGDTSAESKARVAEATKTANDLTGLVRKKKTKDPAFADPATDVPQDQHEETNGHKRKASATGLPDSPKKAKTEE